MAQEQDATSKSQLQCRDCAVDIEKLLQDVEQGSDAKTAQKLPKPAVVFDLSLTGGGLGNQSEDTERGSGNAD